MSKRKGKVQLPPSVVVAGQSDDELSDPPESGDELLEDQEEEKQKRRQAGEDFEEETDEEGVVEKLDRKSEEEEDVGNDENEGEEGEVEDKQTCQEEVEMEGEVEEKDGPEIPSLAERIWIEGLAQFQSDWQTHLEDYINSWVSSRGKSKGKPHSARDYFTGYFRETGKLTTETLCAFETLARLVPSETQRDRVAGELVKQLQRRNKSREGAGTIGENEEKQDENLRFEVEALIVREQHATHQDNEVGDKEDESAKDPKDVRPDGRPSDSEGPVEPLQVADNTQPQQEPTVQEEEGDRRRVITAIYQNWRTTIRDYLPDAAHPTNDESEWPLKLLQTLRELSMVTANMESRLVRGALVEQFGQRKRYQPEKSLGLLKEAISEFRELNKRKARAITQTSGSQSNAGNGARTVDPTASTSAAPDDNDVRQEGVTTSQTPTMHSPLPEQTPSQERTTRPAEDKPENGARSLKRRRIDAPAQLPPEDRFRYRYAVLASRRAHNELIAAESRVALAKERRSAASESGLGSSSLRTAVLKAQAEVEVKQRAVLNAEQVIQGILGVVSDAVWEKLWTEHV